MDRTTRPLVIVAAFAASLVVGLLVMLWALGGLRSVTAPAAIGGPFQLTDQAGQTVTDKNLQGQADADLLRLHPLPGRLPDLAVRDLRGAEGDGQGCRPGQRLVRLGRSRARHARRR